MDSVTAVPAISSSSEPVALQLRSGRQLAGLIAGFVICLALIPLQIDRAFGLPAHPLLIHVPVVFDPLLAVLSIVFAFRPQIRRRYGLGWAAFAVFCLLATVLAAGAGEAFYDSRPFIEPVLHDHKEAGDTLRLVMIGLTAVILLIVAVDWLVAAGRGPKAIGARATAITLSVLVAGLAAGAGFFTVRAGHLGAKSAWQREGGEGRGGFPGPGPQ